MEHTFKGFKSWLENSLEIRKDSADIIVSALRKLEKEVFSYGYVGDGFTLKTENAIRQVFDELDKIRNYTRRSQMPTINLVKEIIKSVYKFGIARPSEKLNDEKNQLKKFDKGDHKSLIYELKQLDARKKQIDAFQTSFRYYIEFLSFMFGFFTIEDIYDYIGTGIKRRTSFSKKSNKKYRGEDYKYGIVDLIKKTGGIFSKDDKAITLTLDNFHDLVNAIVAQSGGKLKNKLSTISMISKDHYCLNNNTFTTNWKKIFYESLNVFAYDLRIDFPDDSIIMFDTEKSELFVFKNLIDDYGYSIKIPILSSRHRSQHVVSVRVTPLAGISKIESILYDLRSHISCLRQYLRPYVNACELGINNPNEYGSYIKERIRNYNIEESLQKASPIFNLLKEYASLLHIDIVAE